MRGEATPEDRLRKLLRGLFEARFGLVPAQGVQVLCPMNRGGLGGRALNVELQAVLNPPSETQVAKFGSTFCPGDKVMRVVNDYERDVFNGDLGVISSLNLEEAELSVIFDGREVAYGFGELDELVLAYATTIHKSQGSEYPAVVIPLSTQQYAMLARNRDLRCTASATALRPPHGRSDRWPRYFRAVVLMGAAASCSFAW